MINDSLVAINVYDNSTDKLLNKVKGIPLLFYWNGEGELINIILNNKQFKENYLTFNNYKDYLNCCIGYFFFKFNEENGSEEYEDTSIILHEHYHFSDFETDILAIDLLCDKMINLYKISVKKNDIDIKLEKQNIIKQIYINLRSLFGDRVQKETLINYIRSEIIKEGFDSINTHYCINILEKLI